MEPAQKADKSELAPAAEDERQNLAHKAGTAAKKVIPISATPPLADRGTEDLLERSRQLLGKMHEDDREEAIDLHEKIEAAVESGDSAAMRQASEALRELLFFVEGQAD